MQNMRLLVRASQGGVRKAVGRVALPPPQAESDEEWRAMTGCMELPAVLRERALVLLRKRAGKERLGLRRMVEKHRPARAKQDAGLPFTRAMYSGERTPEGDAAAAGLTLVADRLPAFYASALRPLIELRKRVPGFVPRTVLLHGAGIGAAAFAVRRAWPDCALQIVAVEPHPEFAKIGQQLTSGMEGVTWRGLGAEGAKRTEGAQGRGRLTADYGELALGDFSPEEARKAAEQAEFDAARRRDAANPYARQPRYDAPDAETHADKAGEQGASMRSEDAAHVAGSVGAGGGGGAVLSGQSDPEGGWDLILCSFAFAEKDVAGGTDVARHLKEARSLWDKCRGAMVVVEPGTPVGFANVARVRQLLLGTGRKQAYMDWKFSFVALTRRDILREMRSVDLSKAVKAVSDGDGGDGGGMAPETVAAAATVGGGEGDGDVNWGRVMRYPMKRSGHVILDICNAQGSIERRVVAKSHGAVGGYRRAREVVWGDAFGFNKFEKDKTNGQRGKKDRE